MMSKFASYKISQKSLTKLRKKGCSESAIKSLASLEEKYFPTSDILLAHIEKFPNHTEILQHKQSILKYSRGYFRLDNWIKDKTTREWVEALIFALVVATIVRTFLFGPFRIPSGSMLPTIQIGDQIFATMYSYGVPIPFTDVKIAPKPVQRGDIIIFPSPEDPSIDFIKRAIALGGETIEIKNDKVYINGTLYKDPFSYFDEDPKVKRHARYAPNVRNYGPVTVPDGYIFAMGDNRYNSHDSRFWGFVEKKKIMGKGQIVYWSKEPVDGLLGFLDLTSVRYGRMFHFLEQ